MSGPDFGSRTFDVIVFDWDGTAVPDRTADALGVRCLVEALVEAGAHVVVVSGTHVGNIDGQLRARPATDVPGSLHLCLNRGSEVFAVDGSGPRLVWKRTATAAEDTALDRAADIAVTRFGEQGVVAKVVSQRVNRRKIDIIPEAEWDNPPKAEIDTLLGAVSARLRSHGMSGLSDAVAVGLDAARDAGLTDARVTSDAKHVEIGLTDKSDSVRWVLEAMAARGIGPGLMLIAGDEFGPLGDVAGSDSLMLVPEASRAVAVSVGVEPGGVPSGVFHLGGGPASFMALLDAQLARRQHRGVPSIDEDPRWVLTFDDEPTRRRVLESLLTLSNGRIGIRGAREEFGAGSEPLLVAAGIYTGNSAPRLLPGPVWPVLMMRERGGQLDRWCLDMRTGVLTRERGDGSRPIRTFRLVSLAEPDAAGMRAEGAAGRLAAGAALAAPAPDIPFDLHRERNRETAATRSSLGGGIAVATSSEEVLAAGVRHIERLGVFGTDSRRVADASVLSARLTAVTNRGFDRLLADHRAEWARRWASAEVSIEGDPETERAVRLSLFHVLSSAAGEGEAAVGARGLSGPFYGGHVFWDSDVFVLPALAALHPAAARAMLEYRLRRLPAARAAAIAQRAAGASWPWESADDGTDVTPRHMRSPEGALVPIRTGSRERHICADIAWAACEYAAWSGDEAFLRGPGRDLVIEGARYWASRVRFVGNQAHLFGMIGPDEYHEIVDDNAFTNVMARWHLRRAAELVERVGGGTAEEVAAWRSMADALVDGLDPETGIYEQFAGYFDLVPIVIADYASPPVAADLLLGAERVRASQIIKQADVLMLYHLVPDDVEPHTLGANVDFYGPRTAHGSSLSPAIQAAVLARAGRREEALALFRLACRIDLDDLTGTTAGGLHLATMGGVWQALAYGFMGMRPRAAGLCIDPDLPSEWNALEMRLTYRGASLRVRVDADAVHITADRAVPLLLGPESRPVQAPPGTTRISREGGTP